MLIYKTGMLIDAGRVMRIVAVGALFFAAVGALALATGGLTVEAAIGGAALLVVPLALAVIYTLRRRQVVQEARLWGDRLELRLIGQRPRADSIVIPLAETTNWRDYIEVLGGYSTRTRMRIIAFRHGERSYGMPVDAGSVLDEDFVRRQLGMH